MSDDKFNNLATLTVARYLGACDGWEKWEVFPNTRVRRRQEKYISRAKVVVKMTLDLERARVRMKTLEPEGAHEQ